MVPMIRGQEPKWFNGFGYGSGYGDGYVSGYGYGSGFGYGFGSGYGYGFGYGDGEYWKSTIQYFAAKWSELQQARLAELQQTDAIIAFWRSNKDGTPCNGGHSLKPVESGMVESVAGPLKICTRNALHATFIPTKWKGDRWWIVALIGEVQSQDNKLGALTREIIGEAL